MGTFMPPDTAPQKGPDVQVYLSCFSCRYFDPFVRRSWGSDAETYCRKLARFIGTGATTPDWCPYLPDPQATWESPEPIFTGAKAFIALQDQFREVQEKLANSQESNNLLHALLDRAEVWEKAKMEKQRTLESRINRAIHILQGGK